jgi:hypothetical protein
MCRSEPQIAQAVTLMTASRECSIFGSGTVSQRMLPFPCQTNAFIYLPSSRPGVAPVLQEWAGSRQVAAPRFDVNFFTGQQTHGFWRPYHVLHRTCVGAAVLTARKENAGGVTGVFASDDDRGNLNVRMDVGKLGENDRRGPG